MKGDDWSYDPDNRAAKGQPGGEYSAKKHLFFE